MTLPFSVHRPSYWTIGAALTLLIAAWLVAVCPDIAWAGGDPFSDPIDRAKTTLNYFLAALRVVAVGALIACVVIGIATGKFPFKWFATVLVGNVILFAGQPLIELLTPDQLIR